MEQFKIKQKFIVQINSNSRSNWLQFYLLLTSRSDFLEPPRVAAPSLVPRPNEGLLVGPPPDIVNKILKSSQTQKNINLESVQKSF